MLLKFVGVFVFGFIFIGSLSGIGLWLLTLITTWVHFSWRFVLVLAIIGGLMGGLGTFITG